MRVRLIVIVVAVGALVTNFYLVHWQSAAEVLLRDGNQEALDDPVVEVSVAQSQGADQEALDDPIVKVSVAAIPDDAAAIPNPTPTNENGCFSYNSPEWLAGPRLGNLRDPRMDSNVRSEMILSLDEMRLFTNKDQAPSSAQHWMKQTICHDDSNFVSMHYESPLEGQILSNQTIHSWARKLIYLAVHIHQHLPALAEAKLRHEHQEACRDDMLKYDIGTFDFECPTAKFLVLSMGNLGLGAIMRYGVVNGLIAGIATNRTVVVVNNAPSGPEFVQRPWLFASCPRRDLQCFYMPPSPCVLTHQELANARTLNNEQARVLFQRGRLAVHLDSERVLALDVRIMPKPTSAAFRAQITQIIRNNILLRLQNDHPLLPVLTKATAHTWELDPSENGPYAYPSHNLKHNQALIYFAMRPNLEYSQRLDEIMNDIIPSDLNPDQTIGLPIRASDKCEFESECLPFHKYMDMTKQTFSRYQNEILSTAGNTQANITNIIVTSEASQIHDAMMAYEKEQLSELPFHARFITNQYDLHQNTGNPTYTNKTMDMDEVMMSGISSLKAQLHARYLIGNCCSNFHLVLMDFLRGGCGAAKQQVARCMQDHEDPNFRLCCQWSKPGTCRGV